MLFRFSLVGAFGFALLLTGCGGGTSTGAGSGGGNSSNPTASLSGSSLGFSSSTSGQATAAQIITLVNNGSATLTISSVSLSGTNASNFAQTNTCGSYLAQNASCSVSVTFTPGTAGSYSASITITDNSGGAAGATQTISLTGALTAPQATLSASSLTFTGVNVGTTGTQPAITLTNGGNATLNISSITLGGTNAAQFAETTTCGATLAAGANCTITATFTPLIATSYGATITIADNASGSPQVITLSGTGVSPGINLSASSITFPASALGVIASAPAVTLTNNGTATLNISSIALSGANPAQFGETNTCGATLAVNASCSISVTFTPAAATSYSAKVVITDNVSGSPQSITLAGAGAGSVSYTFLAFPESDNSVTPLYTLVNAAQHTIDMTMYALQDTTFTADLVNACKRGVVVRVILDQNDEKSSNTTAYNSLNAQTGCSAVWANKAFQVTHQKTIILDGTQVAIMSLNLQSTYYNTTRDFAMVENDATDIAAIQTTFNMDYAAGTPSSGVAGASDYSYQPGPGDTSVLPGGDLIWSPTTAQAAMTNIIANAKSTLLIENEEMASSASYIISALTTACQNGVQVHIAMVNQSSYTSSFNTLKAAGCSLHLYANTTNGYYIHAKAVVADYGLPTQSVYMGSINYSNASMTENRELGMYITDSTSIGQLYTDMVSDYNNSLAIPY